MSAGMEIARCGRTTRRGAPCRVRLPLGDPACPSHLTDDERAASVQRKAEHDWLFVVPDPAEPACWAWPVIPVADLVAAALADLSAAARSLLLESPGGELALSRWQEDRCAICGRPDSQGLVLDHDHTTALIRGYLCRSCNVREAHTFGVFELYRQRNPATILGVASVYESIFGPARPAAPADPDPWHRNPAAGIGL